MKKLNLQNVNEAGTSQRLPAGGYVCRYTDVVDYPDKEYLYMEYDVIEGEFKGYYRALKDRAGFWGGKVYRSYKEKALPMFKRMCSAVTKSNKGFIFDGGDKNSDETTLIGMNVGMVFGEEEYEADNGEIKTRLYVAYECDADKIRKGDFKVPDLKTIDRPKEAPTVTGNEGFMQVPDSESAGVPWS